MGLLNELFLAESRERDQEAVLEGALAAGLPDVLELANMTHLEIELLQAAITGEPWEPSSAEAFIVDDDTDGSWIFGVPSSIVEALGGLDPDRFPEVAAKWATYEEMEDSDVEILIDLLEGFVAMAQRGRATGHRLFFWICL